MDIAYAEDDCGFYAVVSISQFDALATLYKTNENREECGSRFRVTISDLFEFYALYNSDRMPIALPADFS